MGQSFGLDFSRVRVHTDAAAADSAESMDALAYTVGHHVVFGVGQYAPATWEGLRLLAHELAHVVQQSGTAAPGSAVAGPATEEMHERQAERVESVIGHAAPPVGPCTRLAPLGETGRATLVQRKPKPKSAKAPAPGTSGSEGAHDLQPVEMFANSIDQAALMVADSIKEVPGDAVIIGLNPGFLKVYDRAGKALTGQIQMKLDRRVHFSPGVYRTVGGVAHRIYFDTGDPNEGWVIGEVGGALVDTPKTKGVGTAPGSSGTEAEPAKPGSVAPGQVQILDVLQFIPDKTPLKAVKAAHPNPAEYWVVPSSLGGGASGGERRTTGFAGELKGDPKGIQPDFPPWPSSMSGPAMQPFGGTGSFRMSLDFSAFGNNTLASETITRVGTHVYYRWELFDVTEAARKMVAADTVGAKTSKAQIKGAKAGSGAGVGDALGDPLTQAAEKARTADVGSGEDQGATAAARRDLDRDLDELEAGNERARRDLADLTGDTVWEKTSNAVANLTTLALVDVSTLAALAAGGLKILAEVFGGHDDQHEVVWPREAVTGGKVYVVRCVAQPLSWTGLDDKEHVSASSVSAMVVQVRQLDTLVKEAMGEADARLAEKERDIKLARKAGDEAKAKKLEAEKAEMEVLLKGSVPEVLKLQLAKREAEIQGVRDEAHRQKLGDDAPGYGSRIRSLQREADDLKARLNLAEKQEEARVGASKGLPGAVRITANLVSEVTGQTYPLLLCVGPKADEGGQKVWQVSDDTGSEGDRYEGRGATAQAALWSALRKFAADATYGQGRIGISIPAAVPLEPGARREDTVDSKPRNWALAKGRIDDLVKTLMLLGLVVPGAGEVAAIAAAIVAAGHLYHRWSQGHLHLDAATISDVIGVLGGFTALGQTIGRFTLRRCGPRFVVVAGPVDDAQIAKAAQALSEAKAFAKGVEEANAYLGYAGVVWGDLQAINTAMEDSRLETLGPEQGGITHAEARRRRAKAIGDAIQNNGLLVVGEYKKAKEAAKVETAGKEGSPPGEAGKKPPDEAGKKPPEEAVKEKPPEEAGKKPPEEAGKKPPEEATKEPAGTPGEKPAAEGGGKLPPGGVPPGGGGEGGAAQKPRPTRQQAVDAFLKALRGTGDRTGAARDIIDVAGNWKENLRSMVQGLNPDLRPAAEKALVDARARIIDQAWASIKERFPGLRMENAGTVAFRSDVDVTVRPEHEAAASGPEMAGQIEMAANAARALSEAIRERIGNRETDVVIDTNVYSFIGEGRLVPTDPAGVASRGRLNREIALAEQMRGQGPEAFLAFEKSLLNRFKGDTSPEGQAGRVAVQELLAKAQEFYNDRVVEQANAERNAKEAHSKDPPATIRRRAREELVLRKKGELAELSARQAPDFDAMARKQAEILWFEPDAYATASAFDQAVAHQQRLKGAAGSARAELTPAEIVARKSKEAGEWANRLELRAKELEATAGDTPEAREKASKAAAELRQSAKHVAQEASLAVRQLRLLEEARAARKTEQASSQPDETVLSMLDKRIANLEDILTRYGAQQRAGDIWDATVGTGKTPAERLAQAAAAASANVGMMADHIGHGRDLDAKVKDACKYGGRILISEMLGGVGRSDAAVAESLSGFAKSRWDLPDVVPVAAMREMLLDYAVRTSRKSEIVHDAHGNPIGVTDALKSSFVGDILAWGPGAAARLQVLAATAPESAAPAGGGSNPPAPSGGGAPPAPSGAVPGAKAEPAKAPPTDSAPKAPPGEDGPLATRSKSQAVKGSGGAEAGGASRPAPEGPASRVHVLLVTDAHGDIQPNAAMTTTLLAEHPNLDAIRNALGSLGVELTPEPGLKDNADVLSIRVQGPNNTSFVRTEVRYRPDLCTPQHLHHELNHLADFLSGKLDIPSVPAATPEEFARGRSAPFDALKKSAVPAGGNEPLARMARGLKMGVAETMNHLRDIDEYATLGGGPGAARDFSMDSFRNIEEETISRYTRSMRDLLGAQSLSASDRHSLQRTLREYIAERFPELPAEYDRIFNRGKKGRSLWQVIGIPERQGSTRG